MQRFAKKGFTLIELSIVLVIIGLIVGGVLVGRDLIRIAGLRADVSEINKLELAISTFRLKYDCLAGDCINISNYLPQASIGNGDGMISNNDHMEYAFTESAYAWENLARARLIKLPPFDPNLYVVFEAGKEFVSLPSRPNLGIVVGCLCSSLDPSNYFLIGVSAIDNQGLNTIRPPYTTADALYIDKKIDDGLALSGNVVSSELAEFDDGAIMFSSTPAASGLCASTASGNPYNLNELLPLCALRVKGASF